MAQRVEAVFEPCLTLRKYGKRLILDKVAQYDLFKQFKAEAGIKSFSSVTEADYDALLAACSKHGYCLEVIGD